MILVAGFLLGACGAEKEESDPLGDEFVATVPNDPGVGGTCARLESTDDGNKLSNTSGYGLSMVDAAIRLDKHWMWVSKLASEIPDTLDSHGWTLVDSVIEGKQNNAGLQAYIAVDSCHKYLVVAFRGTVPSECNAADSFLDLSWDDKLTCVLEMVSNVITDLVFLPLPMDWGDPDIVGDVGVHGAYMAQYGGVREVIWKRVRRDEYKDYQVYVTGFSLGAGLATLAAFDLAAMRGRDVILYTGGSPRMGHADYRALHDKYVPNTVRIAVNKDPITLIPGYQPGVFAESDDDGLIKGFFKGLLDDATEDIMEAMKGFEHVGRLLHIGPKGVHIPGEKVVVRFEKMDREHHTYDLYGEALAGHRDRCVSGEDDCDIDLWDQAELERDKVKDLETQTE